MMSGVHPRTRGRALWKVASAVASVGLLWLIYRRLDWTQFRSAFLQADRVWLVISVAMIAPITLLRAMRFRWLLPFDARPSLREATRLTIVASAFNLLLPAKAGDFAKSIVLARREQATGGLAASVVIYERLADTAALLAWGGLGLIVATPAAMNASASTVGILGLMLFGNALLLLSETVAQRGHDFVAARLHGPRLRTLQRAIGGWPALLRSLRGRRMMLLCFACVLWFVQLGQLWLFTLALRVEIPFLTAATLSAIAVLAGQLPFSFGGIGARDVALVLLLADYTTPERAAAIGVLTATRTLIPPLFAVPMLRGYLATMIGQPGTSA